RNNRVASYLRKNRLTMKIGLVNEYFPPFAPGGAEWSMLALARSLAKAHQVTVITPNYGATAFEVLDGVHIYRFNYRARLKPGQTSLQYRWLANPLFYLQAAREIERIARQRQLEILHVQNKYSLPGAWLAARRVKIPVVYTVREVALICPLGQCLIKYRPVHPQCSHWRHWWKDCRPLYIDRYLPGKQNNLRLNISLIWLWLDTHFRRWFFHRLDGLIGVSEGILEVYRQKGLIKEQSGCAIYNIPPLQADVSDTALNEVRERLNLRDEKIVLYAGRFSPGKGTQDLVEAAGLIIKTLPDALFLFAGEGKITLSGPHTRSLGLLSQKEVACLYHLANVVVVPSRQPEPLTRVALEAMAVGRPLVGTRVGGTPELIEEGVNGLLVEPGNPAQLAQAILTILADEMLQTQMGQASQRLAQTRFAPEVSLEKLLNLYHQTIATQKYRLK
ncbi:MAG: glycosyltransferase family 4 protein, partial [Anaerolineae bacterium]